MRTLPFIMSLAASGFFGALELCSAATNIDKNIPAPRQAQVAGFTLNTFSTNMAFSPSTVDTELTYSPGFQWYFINYFGNHPTTEGTTLSYAGAITTEQNNGTLGTIAQTSEPPYYVGTAFGGGGYFEADIIFSPDLIDRTKGFPAVWAMSAEHLVGLDSQRWPGQAADYHHFIEVDTFEYSAPKKNSYAITLHDWYGVWGECEVKRYCDVHTDYHKNVVKMPSGKDWSTFHKIGMLWIPSTDTEDGILSFYFDDIKMESYRYSKYSNQNPPPTASTPWTFGIIDHQHLGLIFGSGSSPMTVRSINVWQASSAANLRN